jgi:hypothetical protein
VEKKKKGDRKMKIECEEKKHIRYSTECKIPKYCCRKMKQVFNPKYKNSYSDGSGHWRNSWEITECGLKIPIRENSGCSGGIAYSEYISYCPFCGEEIE